ncbi:hypothetical protein BTA51_07995 [Hahella sp. CCB-MM4]|uniref:DMT family transporter n=1 Tax=Hahella sp. (strain CCB-MM4) TaxID=1926491 RepID=UPI000B9C560E|nr:DMT family transporter [Hahella sp. CCB-MM4]OZG73745.1 hypothetical protein BTA51_07995 [Hahella sp. CCB-MM4]
MTAKDSLILTFLAAIWGASFLFMRVAVPEFGPIAMIQLRIGIAALCLLPFLLWRYRNKIDWSRLPHYIVLGITNSALPFTLLGFATVHVSAGYTSLLNSSVPLWSAIVGALWLGDWLTRWQLGGIMLGFLGVFILVLGKGELSFSGPTMAIIACTLATMSYGVSANYTKRYLSGTQPIVLATMSQATAAILMLPLTWLYWPSQTISSTAWVFVTALGAVCTAFAYILFYGLISRVGPTKTVSVTFLVPVFAMLWGHVYLAEQITAYMLVGCLVILIGTAFTIGLIAPARIRPAG